MINMLPGKVFICCKRLSNRIRILKTAFKKLKPRMSYLITRGDHRKIVKVKVWRVKYAPFTGIAKGIDLAHGSKYLSVRHGDHQWSRWLLDIKIFK